MKVIHLWAGASFHEDGYIVGNKEGLESLRRAIDYALVNSDCDVSTSNTEVSASDGEGYDLHIILTKDTDKIALPYTEDFAEEQRDDAVYPWHMVAQIKAQPPEKLKA